MYSVEYALLEECVTMLNGAHQAIALVLEGVEPPPGLDRMSRPDLEAMLEATLWSQKQRKDILSSSNRAQAYRNAKDDVCAGIAEAMVLACSNYVVLNGLYFDEAVAMDCWSACKNLREALRHRRLSALGLEVEGQRSKAGRSLEAAKALIGEVDSYAERIAPRF